MRYVALLRGINVGGKAKIEMARLRLLFETLGMHDVRTYINSGNVLFSATRPKSELTHHIERAIEQEFGLQVPVLLRSQAEIAILCQAIPTAWENNTAQRTDVLFLWEAIDNQSITENLAIKPEIENVLYTKGALVWNIGRQHVRKSGAIKLINTPIYAQMTIRNLTTVRKLDYLLSL